MENFWPTTATGWLALTSACVGLGGTFFGGFGFLLNKYVTQPLKEMRDEMREMRTSHSAQLNQHETRLTIVEKVVFKNED